MKFNATNAHQADSRKFQPGRDDDASQYREFARDKRMARIAGKQRDKDRRMERLARAWV